MSRALAARGYRVMVADVDGEAAQATAAASGGASVEVDVRDFAANRAMVAATLERYGRLDALVLSAGVNSGIRPADLIDLDRYRRTNGVNVDGVVFGIDAARPALAERGGGIVVLSSLAALAPENSNPVYTLGKAAVLGYLRALAGPLRPSGITVNAVCPAFVDTPLLGQTRSVLEEQGFPLIPPADVAAAVLALLESGGTGQVWTLVAGRPPVPCEFPGTPTTLLPDGTEARLTLHPPRRPAP